MNEYFTREDRESFKIDQEALSYALLISNASVLVIGVILILRACFNTSEGDFLDVGFNEMEFDEDHDLEQRSAFRGSLTSRNIYVSSSSSNQQEEEERRDRSSSGSIFRSIIPSLSRIMETDDHDSQMMDEKNEEERKSHQIRSENGKSQDGGGEDDNNNRPISIADRYKNTIRRMSSSNDDRQDLIG